MSVATVSIPTPAQTPAQAVSGAIRQAARATGTSFEYLLATAHVESGFNPRAAARTSSARGLFQFIEQTWLGTVKESGPGLGYGKYAGAITRTRSGRYEVSDPALRREILALRQDPAANAAMAGAFTKANAAYLTRKLGRAPSESELYIAHFFGAGGAGKLIALAAEKPQARAADIYPGAARANRSIFYDRNGRARSLAGVVTELSGRYQVARAAAAPIAVAAVRQTNTATTAAAPDTAAIANAYAAASPHTPPRTATIAEPIFQGLFHDADRRGPVAPAVSALWRGLPAPVSKTLPAKVAAATAPAKVTAARGAVGSVAAPTTARAVSPVPVGVEKGALDLFRAFARDVRAIFGA